jgi:8-oxo-dGTP pyrophosphatase MutT (NUDIX family)
MQRRADVNADAEAGRRDLIAANLARFRRVEVERPDLKPASVAVCILPATAGDVLLITRRAPGLRAHAGQWALPGGRRDEGETAIDGALRELAEEVGLELGPDSVLGLLDDYVTRSGYVMTPVVCWAGSTGHLAGSEAEVASLHEVPLADLDVEPRIVSIPESDAPVIQLPLLGGYLHAPTAAIVHQFCRIACRGEVHRVAHYEQPVFAWR